MSVQRVLQIDLAVLVVLSTLLLCMGQGSYMLTLVALPAALLSIPLCDVTGWLRLNRPLANLAALVAVAFSVSDFFDFHTQHQLLAIANLLVYLQIILLFQAKTVRVDWQLLALSLLQVVVAAALSDSLAFGLLTGLYAVLSITAMTLLLFYSEQSRVDRTSSESALRRRSGQALGRPGVPMETGPGSVAPLLPMRVFGRFLVRHVLTVAAASLGIAAGVFLMLPRSHRSWGDGNVAQTPLHVTGFSTDVSLNDSQWPILQDDQIVMRVKLTRYSEEDAAEPYLVADEPLFRGAVETRYRRGVWTGSARNVSSPRVGFRDLAQYASTESLVRQEIFFEASHNSTFFSIDPIVLPLEPIDQQRLEMDGTITRHNNPRDGRPFNIVTAGLYDGKMAAITPHLSPAPLRPEEATLLCELDRRRPDSSAADAQSPEDAGLPRLTRTAAEVLSQTSLPQSDHPRWQLARARALESYLRDSGRYRYTLSPPARPEGVDPTEDFVAAEDPAQRAGHCEFFASALALMLRSQQIPARVVRGYKGGDWNSVGGYYQVRQLHAHAWTEAYLAPNQIPDGLRVPGETYDGGAWLRLDATPAGDDPHFGAATAGPWSALRDLADHLELLWRNYIISFNRERQDRLVYHPLAGEGDRMLGPMASLPWWKQQLDRLADALGLAEGNGMRRWFSWRVGVLTFVLLWVLWGIYRAVAWGVRQCVGRLRGRWNSAIGSRRASVDFYRRLEILLARHQFRRPPGQTQYEFARSVGGQFAESDGARPIAAPLRDIVDAFYRVRFGSKPIEAAQREKIDHALEQIRRALG